MEKFKELLEENKPIDFSENIEQFKKITSKVFIPFERNNKVEYQDISKSFKDITNEFKKVYQKLKKVDDFDTKMKKISMKKKELFKSLISKLKEDGYKVIQLNQFNDKNYEEFKKNNKSVFLFENKLPLHEDLIEISKKNKLKDDDLDKLLDDYLFNQTFYHYTPSKQKNKHFKELNNRIEEIKEIFEDYDILIKNKLENKEIVLFDVSNSKMLKESLKKIKDKKIRKIIDAFDKLEKYEYKKLLLNDKLTESIKSFFKELIEPLMKLINYQKLMINNNDNIPEDFTSKFTVVKQKDSNDRIIDYIINPLEYPYYEKNQKEYKTFDFVNTYLKYLINQLDRNNKKEIDFIINIIFKTLLNYSTVKSGKLTTYYKMILSLNTFDQTKNLYFVDVLKKNLIEYYQKMQKLGNTETYEFFVYNMNELFFMKIYNIESLLKKEDENKDENVSTINYDEEVKNITNKLINLEKLQIEKKELQEKLNESKKEISDKKQKELQEKLNEINKKIGYVDIKPIKKEKTNEEIRMEMIKQYTEILDRYQNQLDKNRRNFKLGKIQKEQYLKNMKEIEKNIEKYEKIKKEFNIKKYKAEINKKINHDKIVYDYRPNYEDPEDIVLYPTTHQDKKFLKLMNNKVMKKLFKDENFKKSSNRFEKIVETINYSISNPLLKVDIQKLKNLRPIIEKFIRELSKKLYNYNILIKSDQNKPYNLVYYPLIIKIIVAYYSIHNLLSKSGMYCPIKVSTKKRQHNGLFIEYKNEKVHIFDSKNFKKIMIPINIIQKIELKKSDDKFKEIKKKIKNNKKACVYIDYLLLNEKRTKNMLPKEKLKENIQNGLFSSYLDIHTKSLQKVIKYNTLYPELFIDGEYENLEKVIFNRIFKLIKKEKKLNFNYKMNIEKSLILKKKEKSYEKIKQNLLNYHSDLIVELEKLKQENSLINLVALNKQKLFKEFDGMIKTKLNEDYKQLIQFSLYYQVNENNNPSENYLKIKERFVKMFEPLMKKYKVTFLDILTTYKNIFEVKNKHIQKLMRLYKGITKETEIKVQKNGVKVEEKSKIKEVLRKGLQVNYIEIDKMFKRDDFIELVQNLKKDVKKYNTLLNDERKKVEYMKKFYDSIMNKKFITSFDLGRVYDSKVNLMTTIFQKDNVNYQLTNCVSIVSQFKLNECPYCPFKNKRRNLIHLHILNTHKSGIEKFVEIENIQDITKRTLFETVKFKTSGTKTVKNATSLKVNNIDCIIKLYNENKYLYINYLKKADDRMYKFHKFVMKKVNQIRFDMNEKLEDYYKTMNILGMQKEAHKIVKIITGKDFSQSSQEKKELFNRRVSMIINRTENYNNLIDEFVEEAFRQFTKKVSLKEYYKYCKKIKEIISKNILESLKYDINFEELYDRYNFMQLDDKYKYLKVNNKEDLEKIIKNIHKNNIIKNRENRCYSSIKDFLRILDGFLKNDSKKLVMNMFSTDKEDVFVKNHFIVYLMLKYIIPEGADLSYYNKLITLYNTNKNFKSSYYFENPSTIPFKESNIDLEEWTNNFEDEEKKLLLKMIKNFSYLSLCIQNYFTFKEIKENRYQEKLLQKLIIDFMNIEHYSIKDFMKNYLDIVEYERKYSLANKKTKQEENQFFKEQKFNFVDTLLEDEEQRENTEQIKENVEANKEKVKKIMFDFNITEADEERIVREFNELKD